MIYAKDINGNRIDVYEADKSFEYYCPVCGRKVIPKQGDINSWHFSHISSCEDSWSYDMSEWHQNWQKKYPIESVEVVITYNNISHRADAVVGKYVIEFQHSPLSASEFMERNKFYTDAGYKIIWLFDLRHLFGDTINYLNNDSDTKFSWKYPMKTLSSVIPQKWKNGAILFELSDNLDDCLDEKDKSMFSPWISKVTWAICQDNIFSDYGRFAIDDESFDLTLEEDLDMLLMNKWQRFDDFLLKNVPWKKKCSRVRGNPLDYYKCEVTHEFHNDACAKCKYNLIREYRKGNSYYQGGLFFYCCYPREVNNETNPHGGYFVDSICL